ncbi:unnamed protein product [Rotaria sordida]|uniref:MULE transposase domain-containing protein n=1 Tax=Rotaria sordida TaxID=392033 RepID=A0A819LCW5_9BILA|nr:unnamed protein product [Rotaria sordida]
MINVKARINNETTAIGQIYNEELVKANLSKSALAVAATARQANSALNQARRLATPTLPTSIDFDIPSKYKRTTNGERYLLNDRVQHRDDGTFDSSPPHFDQIYSIHGIRNDHNFVCAIAVLGGRSGIIYKELFSILTQHAHRLNLQFRPSKISSDFEPALVKTVAAELPNTRHVGCNFHFVKAVYRQIQQLDLTTVYRDDEAARSTARQLMALALIPVEKLEDAFEQIASEAPHSIEPLIKYFNGYWMTKVFSPAKYNQW